MALVEHGSVHGRGVLYAGRAASGTLRDSGTGELPRPAAIPAPERLAAGRVLGLWVRHPPGAADRRCVRLGNGRCSSGWACAALTERPLQTFGALFLGLAPVFALYNRTALQETPTVFWLTLAFTLWAYGALGGRQTEGGSAVSAVGDVGGRCRCVQGAGGNGDGGTAGVWRGG